MHTMKLQPEPLRQLANGTKTIEVRLFDEKRQTVAVHDTIAFTNRETSEVLLMRVVRLHRYARFEELFTQKKIACGFEGYTVEQAVAAMRHYYSEDDERRYGVVGIEVEQVND